MKDINIPADQFYRVTMSRERFKRNLYEAINAMKMLRDMYGHDEETAILMAVNEHVEGLDTCAELQESGDWFADKSETLYCKFITQ